MRQFLEPYAASTSDLMFKDYPRGACGPTAELIGRYLKEVQPRRAIRRSKPR